jgi:hypothetical protein
LLTTGDPVNRRFDDFCKFIDRKVEVARLDGVLEALAKF